MFLAHYLLLQRISPYIYFVSLLIFQYDFLVIIGATTYLY